MREIRPLGSEQFCFWVLMKGKGGKGYLRHPGTTRDCAIAGIPMLEGDKVVAIIDSDGNAEFFPKQLSGMAFRIEHADAVKRAHAAEAAK